MGAGQKLIVPFGSISPVVKWHQISIKWHILKTSLIPTLLERKIDHQSMAHSLLYSHYLASSMTRFSNVWYKSPAVNEANSVF